MALPLLGLAAISAAGGLANTISTADQNQKSRDFQREMFDKTNAYNSPLEQRKRLQEAGLNPNLVYGGSSGGTAGTASQPAKPDFNPPPVGDIATGAIKGGLDYINAKAIQSTTDVNEARTEQIKQETINAGIESVNKTIKSHSGAVDLSTKMRLYDNTIKLEEERLNNLSQNTNYTVGKNSREERIAGATIDKLQTEINNNKTRGVILDQEAIMKKLDAALYRDWNLRPDDPFYYKIIGRILDGLQIPNPLKP